MNKYVKLFMEDNDLEIEERFEVYKNDELFQHYSLHFNVDGKLINDDNAERRILLVQLFTGELRVVKLPWKPKISERYYFLVMTRKYGYEWYNNQDSIIDKRIIKYGIIAKTEEKIIELRNKEEWWNENIIIR